MEQKKVLNRSFSDFVSKEAEADLFVWNIIGRFNHSVHAALCELSSIPLESFNCEYPELFTEAANILSDLQKLDNASQVALMVKRQSIYEKYLKFEVSK